MSKTIKLSKYEAAKKVYGIKDVKGLAVSTAHHKKFEKLWKSKYPNLPIPITIDSLISGLPLNEGGQSVSLNTLQQYQAIRDIFNLSYISGEQLREHVSGMSPQTECEKVRPGQFIPLVQRKKIIKYLTDNREKYLKDPENLLQDKPFIIAKFPNLMEAEPLTPTSETLTEKQICLYSQSFITPFSLQRKIRGGGASAPTPGQSSINCIGRLFGGYCWLCRKHIWSYFENDKKCTPCGECEHKGAIWASFISSMLARVALMIEAYANSHPHCNQRKKAIVGIRMDTDYRWVLDSGDVEFLVDTILAPGQHTAEYDPTLRDYLDDPRVRQIMIDNITLEYQAWCNVVNNEIQSKLADKSVNENLDKWLFSMLNMIIAGYGINWLKELLNLELKAKENAIIKKGTKGLKAGLKAVSSAAKKKGKVVKAAKRGGAAYLSKEKEDEEEKYSEEEEEEKYSEAKENELETGINENLEEYKIRYEKEFKVKQLNDDDADRFDEIYYDLLESACFALVFVAYPEDVDEELVKFAEFKKEVPLQTVEKEAEALEKLKQEEKDFKGFNKVAKKVLAGLSNYYPINDSTKKMLVQSLGIIGEPDRVNTTAHGLRTVFVAGKRKKINTKRKNKKSKKNTKRRNRK